MNTNSLTWPSGLAAQHRYTYVLGHTHLNFYRIILVEVDWCNPRDIECTCFTCERKKYQGPWPPNLLGRKEAVVGTGEKQ
jgi:hypothetical protein